MNDFKGKFRVDGPVDIGNKRVTDVAHVPMPPSDGRGRVLKNNEFVPEQVPVEGGGEGEVIIKSSIWTNQFPPTDPAYDIWIKLPQLQQYEKYIDDNQLWWIQTGKTQSGGNIGWLEWFDFLWVGDVENNELVNSLEGSNITILNNDIVTSYIPDTSTASFIIGAETLTVANLIGTDRLDIIVKYDNDSPHHIRMIGIPKVPISPDNYNELHDIFQLWVWWSDTYNDYGVLKANRTMGTNI